MKENREPIWWDPHVLSINSPLPNTIYGNEAPDFSIAVVEAIADIIWYTLYDGIRWSNNFIITSLTGTINQIDWNSLIDGDIIIRFYVKDAASYENYEDVIIIKDTSQTSHGIPGTNLLIISLIIVVGIISLSWLPKRNIK